MARSFDVKNSPVYDISIVLGKEQIDAPFPGVNAFSREEVFSLEKNDPCLLSNLVLNCHTGSHIDVSSHFVSGAKRIDDYPIHRFILPAIVVEIADAESIKPAELSTVDIHEGDALLFKTGNSRTGISRSPIPSDRWVYMTPEAADLCVEKKISLVGIDYLAPEKPGATIETAVIHQKLFAHNILILESISLHDVPPGKYTLFCLPLKIQGAEASPVRAILIA